MFFSTSLVLLTLFTRFFGLNWGNGYFFHPDENNMAYALSRLSWHNFNPHFFAYGQFPLYLSFFTFGKSIISLRIWSAIFSCLAIYVFYLIGKRIFKKNNYIFLLLLIFNPGLIQLAHFGTTESILVFVFITNIYISILLKQKFKFKYILFAALISGIGIATKISAAIFVLPILLVTFSPFYLILTLFFSILFSPYSLIAYSEFLNSMNYEISVATGKTNVFYTIQFWNTIPYIFQLTKIFPYVSGLSVFILAIFGFSKIDRKIENLKLIFIPVIIFFLYQGQLFVKWTRFMSPIFFIFPFLATFFIISIKNISIKNLLIILCILPGIFFTKQYFVSDIRVTASSWINNNLKKNASILTESANVLDLPLNNYHNYDVLSYDFYDLPANTLPPLLDYIIIPSRRVFMNQTKGFYTALFNGSLAYRPLKQFTPNNYFLLNDEKAEETWTVFDRPTIRIYEKQK